ncbi:hypothetical protein BRDID11004_60460 [Bradyrhizobium diazoefficiens]|uniref:Uncharacterized protein n=1 Tax=Bradyrhizobium diazoefficiens TaxID=1355477 RepID=A0A810AIH2_9BRAD|nr:hypothetical protein [Bradyrhizobium diazoefficiens]BBZ93056.1 hypothetical protein F07S3_28890 [Bradyrhizobium diazoefficiens]BCA10806.1 hypothetical protein BDHF08_26530 [Bradyrhizobium diazoefficiens]BCE55142.1 hypothetical protein XF5B_26540 [Bradyrhizobium diazoefficiens]BCE63875.1 hypothetical protein XF6B_26740 [Bradyrhizobium diazoefficiens]
MARRKPDELPHIILNIQTKRPIELDDFVSAFSSISSQYEKFVRAQYPELSGDAKIFVREVRAGSIEADLIPWAMQGLSAVVNVIEQIQIVEKFVKTYGAVLGKYLHGSKEVDATRTDLKDFMGAVSAIANDPNGRSTLQAVAYEDGKKKIRAALVFDTVQAREAQKQIEDQKLLLESATSADHQRVLMTFKQSNVKDSVMGKRTGERVAIEDISPRDLPLIYASELAEQRIKHEVREADENVYKKGFIVDVNVQLVGGRPAGYRVTNLHQVIDLPE